MAEYVSDNYDAYDFQSSPPSSSTIDFPSTQATDLPFTPWENDWQGTTSQPSVSEIPRSSGPQTEVSGIDFSNILKPITATAESFLNVWGRVANISTSAATQRASQEISRAQLDLAKAQTLGAIDVAKTKAATEGQISKIQAQTQVAKESAILASTKGGALSLASNPSIFVLGGLALSLWLAFRKGGAK